MDKNAVVSREELGYQTTIRKAPGADAHTRFAGTPRLSDRALASALAVLWGLLVLVVMIVLIW